MADTDTTPKLSVVLVDDDKFLADMYGIKFTKEGYGVHAFLSVSAALQALRGGLKADGIVFDIVMPEHDGFFLLDSIMKEHLIDAAAKIALTNQGNESERQRALSMGADAYIIKASMIPSEVVAEVGKVIKGKSGAGAQ